MAKAPKDPNAPKRSRSMKPSRFFLLFKGSISELKLVKSAEDALDMKDQDPTWNMQRLTLPKKVKTTGEATPA